MIGGPVPDGLRRRGVSRSLNHRFQGTGHPVGDLIVADRGVEGQIGLEFGELGGFGPSLSQVGDGHAVEQDQEQPLQPGAGPPDAVGEHVQLEADPGRVERGGAEQGDGQVA